MYYYILNPTAGGGTLRGLQDKLRDASRRFGIEGEFAKTTSPGDATRLARYAIEKGYTTVVAVGGDGTVNEVINGANDRIAIGVVPIGHTNAVAGQLGVLSWEQALPVLAMRRISEYNLIAAGQQYFVSTLTLGFETELDKQLEAPAKNLKGRLGHFRTSWQQAGDFGGLTCILKTEAFTLQADAFSLSVTNQKFLSPQSDNRLSITLSDRPHRPSARANYLWQVVRGISPLEEVATTRFLADKVQIDTDPSTGITIDGKLAGRTPIAIRLTDRKVRFIVEKADTAMGGKV
jgi:diacylglycerol kinase family enzyme